MEILIETVVECPNIFNMYAPIYDKLELFTTKPVSSRFSLDLAFAEIVSCCIIGGDTGNVQNVLKLKKPM